jgi:NhaA family Na+:H+ antiporter
MLHDRTSDVADFLREETTGGKLLLAATVLALLWANVAGDSYDAFWGTHVALGPDWLHLDLTLGGWAADGLLAIFFFVAGLELKRELVVGELSDRRSATLPFFAAAGGMILPAAVALAVSGGAATEGGAWAVPVATDIAFALGVLAIAGASLPSGVRVLLLSMAVIDDLAAIALIAILFTSDLALGWLVGGVAIAVLWRLAFRVGLDRWWLLWPLAIAVWICIHASGVHATVAGILLGLLTPVTASERLEHRLHPVSAGLVVPVFALAAAGISLGAIGDAASDKLAIAIFTGLLVGKLAGVFGGARLAVALRVGTLPRGVAWRDVAAVAMLGAIGYTVALLIAQLAFDDAAAQERAAAAVLAASALASVLAVAMLRRRSRPAADRA